MVGLAEAQVLALEKCSYAFLERKRDREGKGQVGSLGGREGSFCCCQDKADLVSPPLHSRWKLGPTLSSFPRCRPRLHSPLLRVDPLLGPGDSFLPWSSSLSFGKEPGRTQPKGPIETHC